MHVVGASRAKTHIEHNEAPLALIADMPADVDLRHNRQQTRSCRGCPCCSPVFTQKLMFGLIKEPRHPVIFERRGPLISCSGCESASVAETPTFQLLPPPVWARKPVATNYSR